MSQPDSLKVEHNIQDTQYTYEQNKLSYDTWKNNQISNALELQTELTMSKDSILSRIAELERTSRNTTIYAPITGRITEIQKINKGDYVLAGEEILRIVPETSKGLKADMYVDPTYIARVKIGNPVRIKFLGLPPSQYGQIETSVSLIPPDMKMDASGLPIFVVEAYIEDPVLNSKDGKTANLLPGITAEARIITDKSTVLKMVLRKLDFIN